ncbi:hypothetical protein [Candidatus Mycobacterium methanotrophicum]|uniref:Integral membrane protein n=1 Tax=Candidatus Mycobacterium methanotrophicum TaxID=2943498 RepID=A0ABY4QP11_9MYCO|nr:hypothetical protein [Candidatus Mycobacterium methanotrophicum]UQX11685.1 hypothetical protein M5I08_04295 [Candidatus Mycobacterium methanotrophicum]
MRQGGQLVASFLAALSAAFGFSMVAAVGVGAQGPALIAVTAALVALVAGVLFRPVATLAVLLTVGVIALSDPAAALAAVSGLSAAVYLVLRHAAGGGAGLDGVSGASVAGALGFAFAGLVATAFPLQLPWLPLLAPLAVFTVYLLATRPFLQSSEAVGSKGVLQEIYPTRRLRNPP